MGGSRMVDPFIIDYTQYNPIKLVDPNDTADPNYQLFIGNDTKIRSYFKDIVDRILFEHPFTESELTSRIISQAIDRSLSLVNMYHPFIGRTESMPSDAMLLRSYASEFDYNHTIQFSDEFDHDIGTIYVWSKTYDLLSILTPLVGHFNKEHHRISRKYFDDGVVLYSCLFMSNIRRSASFSNLPFDLKGDQLFSEYDQKISDLKELMINTSDHTL
jgi:hypothetical protein